MSACEDRHESEGQQDPPTSPEGVSIIPPNYERNIRKRLLFDYSSLVIYRTDVPLYPIAIGFPLTMTEHAPHLSDGKDRSVYLPHHDHVVGTMCAPYHYETHVHILKSDRDGFHPYLTSRIALLYSGRR